LDDQAGWTLVTPAAESGFVQEWRKLNGSIREQFKKKLIERLANPKVDSAKLSGMTECYKIKLKAAGYRLVYQIQEARLVVVVVAVGRREGNAVYFSAEDRL
jgi:mRNA interferase RelE/StbE